MVKSLLVNLVAIPAFAYLRVSEMSIAPEYATSVVLLVAGPPFGANLAEISVSGLAYASGLMSVLAIVSVATIQVALALLLSSGVSVDLVGIVDVECVREDDPTWTYKV